MANVRGKSIDNTHLSIDTAEERIMIHRDYIAHVFRWTHVARKLGTSGRYQTARVLDIGCGVDMPLAKMLYSNRFIVADYIGLDYNKSAKFKTDMFSKGKFPLSAYGSVDFASKQVLVRKPEIIDDTVKPVLYVDGDVEEGEHDLPNIITCFEVLEHVEPSHARHMLTKMRSIMLATNREHNEDPIAYISTPCYDSSVGAADNHVNEMKREALGALIEDLGYEIAENYGTFASIRDYRDVMFKEIPGSKEVYERLYKYYDTNILATIFAPLMPAYARNNIWILKIARSNYIRKFKPLSEVSKPWTSSEKWEELDSYKGYNNGII